MNGAEITEPANGATALLIIDMINDLQFEGAEKMRAPAQAAAAVVAKLRDEADRNGVPVVYVNDNFGQWHSERSRIIAHALQGSGAAQELVQRIKPRDDDYFVIKPQFSGFYSTNLPALLPRLGASKLILTGVAADICVLFTAGDAHMREYDLWVPSDAVASSDAQRTRWALEIMQHSMKADIRPTDELSLGDWIRQTPG